MGKKRKTNHKELWRCDILSFGGGEKRKRKTNNVDCCINKIGNEQTEN